MSTEKTNDRNASTEQLFDSEQLKKTRLRDEDDNIAPAGSGEEELSLQNIFIDKGEDVVSDASGMVTAAGSIPAINTSAQISANADSKVADQAVDRTPPVHSEESTQDSPDKPESVLSAQAELGSPIVLTASDVLPALGYSNGNVVEITSLTVSPESGTIVDNGDGTWTLHTYDNQVGEVLALQANVSEGGNTTSVEGLIEVPADSLMDNPQPTAENTNNSPPGDVFETVQGSSTQPADTSTNSAVPDQPDTGPENQRPIVENVDLGATLEDTSITFRLDDLLHGTLDPDGDTLTVTDIRVDPELGSITINGDGSFTFDPAANFNGEDLPLTFTVSDGEHSVESNASLNVLAVNDDPVADMVDLASVNEDSSLTFGADDLLAGASDIDGDNLKVTSVTVDEKLGSVSDNGDGTFTFKPTENFNGDDVPLNFTVSDGVAEVQSTAFIDVAAVNDGPVAEKVDLGAIKEDTSITFKADELLAGASDIDGDDLKVTSVKVDEKLGSVSDNGDGTFTFKPTENFNGDDVPLSFTVSDGTAEVESTAFIDVAAVNDGPVAGKVDLGSIKEDTS
ncbi:MAG: cadherin-like domain-containing protein, partial [Gammaproteobacteria bacterium]|nr:cadherin-like domain-containing protein [Gammaproteobacteria bacterium]